MKLNHVRASTIAAYMERIAPSEAGAIRVVPIDDSGSCIVAWTSLPDGPLSVRMLLTVDGGVLVSGTQGRPHGQDEFRTFNANKIATALHTEDEIARKFLVDGLEQLAQLERLAIARNDRQSARHIHHYAAMIHAGLVNWGAGTTPRYERPSPQMRTSPPPNPAAHTPSPEHPNTGPHGATDSHALPHLRIRQEKINAIIWLSVNILFAVAAMIVSLVTYLNAEAGESFILWWGPVIFGIINSVRLAVKVAKLSELEHAMLNRT